MIAYLAFFLLSPFAFVINSKPLSIVTLSCFLVGTVQILCLN